MQVFVTDIQRSLDTGCACRIQTSWPSPWGFSVYAHGDSPNQATSGKPILLMATSLGNTAIDVPNSYRKKFFVIVLHQKSGTKHYGYGSQAYYLDELRNINPDSWRGEIDTEPLKHLAAIIESCIQLGCLPMIKIVGFSAGASIAASIAGTRQTYWPEIWRLQQVVLGAGAFHSSLYSSMLHYNPRTAFVVYHHQLDRSSLWEEQACFWMRQKQRSNVHVYLLEKRAVVMFGTAHHDYSMALFARREFWDWLSCDDAEVSDGPLLHVKDPVRVSSSLLYPPYTSYPVVLTRLCTLELATQCLGLRGEKLYPSNLPFADEELVGIHGTITDLVKNNCFEQQTSFLRTTYSESVKGLEDASTLWKPVICMQLAEAFARLKSPREFYDSFNKRMQHLSSGVLQLIKKKSYNKTGQMTVHLRAGDFWMYRIRFPKRLFASFSCLAPHSLSQPAALNPTYVSAECRTITIDDLLLLRLSVVDADSLREREISTLAFVSGVETYTVKRRNQDRRYFPNEFKSLDLFSMLPQNVQYENAAVTVQDILLLQVGHDMSVLQRYGWPLLHRRLLTGSILGDAHLQEQTSEFSDSAELPVQAFHHKSIGAPEYNLMRDRSKDRHLQQILTKAGACNIISVIGPPGTGKSSTIVKLVESYAETARIQKAKCSLNVATPTNNCRDDLVSKLDEKDPKSFDMSMLIARRYVDQVKSVSCPTFCGKTASQAMEKWLREGQNCKVLLQTLGMLCQAPGPFKDNLRSLQALFSGLIVDEAGQVLSAFSGHLAQYLTAGGKLFLIGDPMQLTAVTSSRYETESLLDSVLRHTQPIFLQRQYRMVPSLGEVTSQYFYRGRLEHARPEAKRRSMLIVLIPADTTPVANSLPTGIGHDYAAYLAAHLLQDEGTFDASQTLYMSYYKEQVLRFRSACRSLRVNTESGSVDNKQGREVPYAIDVAGRGAGTGWARSPRRLNVGSSRAKEALIVLLSAHLLESYGTTGPFFQAIVKHQRTLGNVFQVTAPMSCSEASLQIKELMRSVGRSSEEVRNTATSVTLMPRNYWNPYPVVEIIKWHERKSMNKCHKTVTQHNSADTEESEAVKLDEVVYLASEDSSSSSSGFDSDQPIGFTPGTRTRSATGCAYAVANTKGSVKLRLSTFQALLSIVEYPDAEKVLLKTPLDEDAKKGCLLRVQGHLSECLSRWLKIPCAFEAVEIFNVKFKKNFRTAFKSSVAQITVSTDFAKTLLGQCEPTDQSSHFKGRFSECTKVQKTNANRRAPPLCEKTITVQLVTASQECNSEREL